MLFVIKNKYLEKLRWINITEIVWIILLFLILLLYEDFWYIVG